MREGSDFPEVFWRKGLIKTFAGGVNAVSEPNRGIDCPLSLYRVLSFWAS